MYTEKKLTDKIGRQKTLVCLVSTALLTLSTIPVPAAAQTSGSSSGTPTQSNPSSSSSRSSSAAPSSSNPYGATGSSGSTSPDKSATPPSDSSTSTSSSSTPPSDTSTSSTTTSSTSTSSTGTSADAAPASETGKTAPASVTRRDRNFMRELAQQNLAEIELAKLAQTKAQSDSVRSYADRMLTDHTKALDDLRQLAQQKGVTLPTTPSVAHRSQIVMLKAMPVASFEKNYISKGGLSDHEKTQRLLIDISTQAQDPDLKSLSASMLPVVRQHHQLALDMSGKKPVAQ